MTTENNEKEVDPNEQMRLRRAKLQALRANHNAFPNDFRPSDLATKIHAEYEEKAADVLEANPIQVKLAGRMMTRRLMGKASFVHLQDRSGRIQAYIRQDALPQGQYEEFQNWDLGDIIGVDGHLFKTKTGELSIKAHQLCLITKALRPLPDKWHGLTDQELRYRQRYVDLIVNAPVKDTFVLRSKAVQAIREYLVAKDFLEVETPMMHVIPGGATARPFITHHNALGLDLYLRVAPELFLKRLVVGGLERVFEINRNFRNEGLSTRHNPEFTMLEFYQAYADCHDFMDFTENLLKTIVKNTLGKMQIEYQGNVLDFEMPFERLSIKAAISKYHPALTISDLEDKQKMIAALKSFNVTADAHWGLGKLQFALFEEAVEPKLIQPTFITEYPIEVSPLARVNDQNPDIADRAELFMAGREIANMFSELNDPEDQDARFKNQVKNKAAGDLEAMHYDADYITALEYGMPPSAGCGIGIDRLVMILSNSASIRDVLLFPHMRPHHTAEE